MDTSNHLNSDQGNTEKPAILVVTELYPNMSNSFLGAFIARQLKNLSRHYRIVVLTTNFSSLGEIFHLMRNQFRDDEGIHVYYVSYFPVWLNVLRTIKCISHENYFRANKRFTAYRMGMLARRLQRRYRFRAILGQETYIGDEAIPIGRKLGIPKIFTLHGLYPYHEKLFGRAAVASAIRNLEHADRLISVSRLAADSYKANGLRRSDISIIPNGTNPDPAPTPAPFLESFTRGKTVLLSVGFFVPEKRIDRSIYALRDLHDAGETDTVLVLVGKGRLEEELRRLATDLGISQHVVFAGEVRPRDMASIYASSDILLHPSVVESFAMVCLEAMSYGKPVVCTSGIGLLEFIRPGLDAVVVPPDDQGLFSNAVLKLVKHPEDRRRIGEAARLASKSLLGEKQAEEIRRVIESV
jgi:glycosyltransferase involved in cell wall biosynthesis